MIRLLSVFILILPIVLSGQEVSTSDVIQSACENIRQFKTLQVGESSIAMIDIIAEFYERRDFKPAWNEQPDVEDLLKIVDESKLVGLQPEDYHKSAIVKLNNVLSSYDNAPPRLTAEFDIMLSDALLRIVYHRIFGKVDPERLDPNWNIYKEVNDIDPPDLIETIISAPSLYKYVESHRIKDILYIRLKDALAKYRTIAENGGWESIPDGEVIRPGMSDRRIPAIRTRLEITGDIKKSDISDSTEFTETLESGIRYFQQRHGLDDDGIIGKGTIAALNIPVDKKIDQILVNLERLRWILDENTQDFILVNIANFRANYAVDNNIQWYAKAQVGKTYRQTPVFKANLKYMVINPTWTVPPTILAKDVLPAIKKDQTYLKRKNMKVLNRSGKVIDPSTIDWARYSGSNFPYAIRQDPGPSNALGRIKFIFPNKHFVFLHDTPSKSLFNRQERAFSSGCIRVAQPFELALQLLQKQGDWDMKKIEDILDSKKQKTLHLKEEIPVYLLYFTAFPDIDHENITYFRNDVYDRDARILEDLKAEFKIKKQHEVPIN